MAQDFLYFGSVFAPAHPDVGAFGGRISLASDIKVPQWMEPLLGSMAVKEEGDETLINSTVDGAVTIRLVPDYGYGGCS